MEEKRKTAGRLALDVLREHLETTYIVMKMNSGFLHPKDCFSSLTPSLLTLGALAEENGWNIKIKCHVHKQFTFVFILSAKDFHSAFYFGLSAVAASSSSPTVGKYRIYLLLNTKSKMAALAIYLFFFFFSTFSREISPSTVNFINLALKNYTIKMKNVYFQKVGD
jgi:hypothetical protein